MKKKNGFTLLELIIVVAAGLVILSIALSFFINFTKNNIDVKYMSTLQTEAQNISMHIESFGMESCGIKKVTLVDGTDISMEDDKNSEKSYKELPLVDSNGNVDTVKPANNEWISIKEIEIDTKYDDGTNVIKVNEKNPFTISYDKSTFTIQQPEYDDEKKTMGWNKTPFKVESGDIRNILIKPSNLFISDDSGNTTKQEGGKIFDAASIEIKVNLEKKKGFSDVKYSVPVTVTFRNKEASNEKGSK